MLVPTKTINAQMVLLSEDFNFTTNSDLPSGWDTCRWVPGSTTTPSSFPYMVTQYLWMTNTDGIDNSRCASFNANQFYTLQQGLMTPARQFDATKIMKLCFDLKNCPSNFVAYAGGDMDILVTYDNGVTIADTIQLGINSGVNWVHYEFPLTGQIGASNVRIMFLGKAYHQYFLDNVKIVEASKCKPADNLLVFDPTTTGATFYWTVGQGLSGTESTPSDFIVSIYKTDDNSNVLTTTVGSAMSYTATGLEPGTKYRFYVVSDCGASLGHGDTVTVDFQTLAIPEQIPFYIDFENGIPAGSSGENYAINTAAANAKGTKSLVLTTTSTQGAYYGTPFIDFAPDSLEISLLIKTNESVVPISFGLITDPNDQSTFNELFRPSKYTPGVWQEVRFNTANAYDKSSLSMLCIFVGSGGTTVYIDSIHIHSIPSCTRPEAITAVDRTHNSVTLNWQMTNATNYQITAIDGQTVVFQQVVSAPNNSYTVTGLEPNTDYSFSVKAICSASDESELASMTGVARTLCDVADNPEMLESAENCPKNTLPDCWTTGIITVGTGTAGSIYSDYPFYTNTVKHSGSYGFQLRKMKAGTVAYLSSQKRDFGSQSGKYTLRIWVNRSSTTKMTDEGIDLWITPNPGDTVGGTHLGMINRHFQVYPVEDAAGWYQYEYLIDYTGQGYLTIFGMAQYGAITSFDDIEIFETPNCLSVSDLAAENISKSSIDISWTPGGDETQWLIGYTATSSLGTTVEDTLVVTSPRCTISGLLSATLYNLSAFVRAICTNGDTSEVVSLANYAFITECDALTSLPYTMGFEDDEIILDYSTSFYYPLCWKRYNDYTDTIFDLYAHYPYVSTYSSDAHTGNHGLNGTISSNHATNSIVILPQIDTTVFQANQLRVKFWAREDYQNQSTTLYLVAMTDPADFSTCVTVDSVTVSGNVWSEYQMNLADYEDNGSYIGINFTNVSNPTWSTTYIDDLELGLIPPCPDIEKGISVTNVTDTSAVVTVNDDSLASPWQYAIGTADASLSSLIPVDVSTVSVTINGLLPNTSYDIYARYNCSGIVYGTWTNVITFTTTAVPATAPYVCDFEDENENANWMTSSLKAEHYSFTIGTDSNGVYEGDKAIYVTNGNDVYSYTPKTNGNSGRAFATRLFHFDSKVYQINLKWKSTGGESIDDYGRILLTDAATELNLVNPVAQALASNFDVVAEIDSGITYLNGTVRYTLLNCSTYQSKNPDANGWCDLYYVLDMTGREGNYNLVFMWNQNDVGGKANYPLAVDNITINELTCLPASSVIPVVSAHSVDFAINQPSASAWEIIVDTNAIDIGTISSNGNYIYRQIVTNNVLTVSGLSANTHYYYTLRTICDVNDTSRWKDPASITTLCEAVTLPYAEDFESVTSISCWIDLSNSTTTEFSRVASRHKSGSASLKTVGCAAVTPELDVDSLTNYQLSGWVYSTSTPVTLSFMVGTEPTDVSYFSEPIATRIIQDANTWKEFVVTFDSLSSDDFIDFKNARFIAITGSDVDNTLYFDDIEIKPLALCAKPTQVSFSNIGENQYDISFIDNAGASAWIVSTNNRLDTIYSTSATITGLDAKTDYIVKVAAICSASSMSDFTEAGTITTACVTTELPFYCGFEVSEGWSDAANYVPGQAEALCWNTLNMQPNGRMFPYYGLNLMNKNSGNSSLSMLNEPGSGADGYAILPAFDAPTNTLKVEYFAKDMSYSEVEFGYITDPTDDSTFVLLVTHPKTQTFTKRTIMMNAFDSIPNDARLAFRIQQQKSGWIAIDDIHITRILSCSDPNPATIIDITDSSAKLAVSDTSTTHNNWQYVCVPVNGKPNDATPLPVPANGIIEVTGLSSNSEYDFYIRAVCDVDDESNWVRSQFTTDCLPFVISSTTPFVENFESYDYGVFIDDSSCFNTVGEGSSTSNKFRISPNSAPSEEAKTVYNYAHDDSYLAKCLQISGNNSNTPNGFKLIRSFYLEAGKNYLTSAFFNAGNQVALTSKFSFILSSDNSVDTVSTMLMSGKSIPETHQDAQNRVVYPFNEQYEIMKGYFTVPSTGAYYLSICVDNGSTATSSYSCYIDDWTVSEFDGCAPSPVSLDSVADTYAYFTINDNAVGHTWEYMLNDTTIGTPVAISTANFQVSGLSPSSSNKLFVRTICSSTSHSEWIGIDFETACGGYNSYPYNQDFEGDFLPLCWTQFYTNTNSATTANAWKKYLSTTEPYVHSGIGCASLPIKSNTNTTMVTGAFDMSNNPYGYTLSFWMYRHFGGAASSYADDILHVLVSDQPITPQNIGNATEILAIHKYKEFEPIVSQQGLYKYECDIPLTFNNTVYIAFHHTNGTGYALYIDDINISEIPSCRGPKYTPEIIGTTKNTATASFDMAGKDTIEVGWAHYTNNVSSRDIIDSMVCSTSTFTIVNLDSAAEYALFARYICSAGEISPWSPFARFKTKESDCFDPANLSVGDNLDNHHAELSWVGTPDAIGYQYELFCSNVLVDSGHVVAPATSIAFDSLSALSNYTFKVRGFCLDDTTNWISTSFNTTKIPQALPYFTDFDNSSRDSEWQIVTPNAFVPNRYVIGNGTSFSGNRSMYITDNNSTYEYQVATSQSIAATSFSYARILIQFQSGDYMVSYDWKCLGQGFTGTSAQDFGRIFLVPTNTIIPTMNSSELCNDLSSLPGVIPVSDNVLNNSINWTSSTNIVTIDEDKLYYLVVAWTNDASNGNQPPFAIDNISVQKVECLPVQIKSVLNVGATKASFYISRSSQSLGTSIQYAVSLVDDENSISSITTVAPKSQTATTDTVRVSGLQPETDYYFFIRSVCDSTNVSPWVRTKFTTLENPIQLPYVCDFEDAADTYGWKFVDGQYSWFIIGDSIGKNSQKSLYITDDGSRYFYASPGTPSSANGISYAYIPIEFGAATYEIDFDWRAKGQTSLDYGRAFLAPFNVEFTEDELYSGISTTATPTGWIALDSTKMNLETNWIHRHTSVSFIDTVQMNLVFVWRQNYKTDNQPPLAIDNISIIKKQCSPVSNITYSSTTDSVCITAHHGNSGGQIFWHISSNGIYSDTIGMGITDSVVTMSNLQANTTYYIRLGVICEDNDTSYIHSYPFRTACGIISEYPYCEDFENIAAGISDTTWYTNYCWDMSGTSSSCYSYPSDTISHVHSGTKGLRIYNSGFSGNQQYIMMPQMDSLLGKTISFSHKAGSLAATSATLTFGYIINGIYVNINTFDNKSLSWNEYQTTFGLIPDGARLYFKFDGIGYYYIDDIRINKIVQGNTYNDTICFNAPYNKHGFSCGAGSLFPGDTTLTKTVQGTVTGVADSVVTVNIHVRPQITSIAYDSICAGTPVYYWGNETIYNPAAAIYTQTFTAACGCDSTVALNLYVLPESDAISTTICQGDSIILGGQTLKTQGTYIVNITTAQGCIIPTTVNLSVIDTLQISNASICEGNVYTFEGQNYSTSGIYRVPSTSPVGCPIVKELHLTVYPADTTIVTSFCRGGSITVAGIFVINSDTVFDATITNAGTSCSTTYHISATTIDPTPGQVYDIACEDHLYSGYGISDLVVTQDTILYISSRTQSGLCDSVTAVNLTYVNTAFGQESATIRTGETYIWHDNTYTQPGTYTDTMRNASAENCDSIVTLTLTLDDAVDNITSVVVSIVPNPVTAGQTAFVYADADVATVEILNQFGQIVTFFIPSAYPIEVEGIDVEGIYYVRLTLYNGDVAVQKLMVK